MARTSSSRTSVPATLLSPSAPVTTLINVFTVDPSRQQELVDLLVEATEARMRYLPGFISANIHRSVDGRQVVNYAQWQTREDFEAVSTDPEAAVHMKKAAAMATFNPIVCELVHADHA